MAQRPELILQTGPTGTTKSLAFTPDGKTLAGGGDYGVKLWDVTSGTELRALAAGDTVRFSPDGKTLVSTGGGIEIKGSGFITWWNVATGAVKRNTIALSSIALSPDWKTVASAETENHLVKVTLWNVESNTRLRTLSTSLETVWVNTFSPDGKTLAISDGYGIEFWDVATGTRLRIMKGTRGLGKFVFSPDGKMLATGYFASREEVRIKLWDAGTGAELRTITWRAPVVDDYLRSLTFSPDGKTLASATHDVKLWDVATGAEVRTLKWPAETLPEIVSAMRADSVTFSPDGKTVAAGSGFAITLWDVASGEKLRVLNELAAALKPPRSFGRDPKWGDCGDKFKFADSLTGAQSELRSLKIFSDAAVSGYPLSPDGKTVALGCGVDAIRTYDVITGTLTQTLIMDPALHDEDDNDEKDQIHKFAFSPNGRIIVTSNDATDRVWNVATGRQIRSLKAISDSGGDLIAFSPDGKILALAGNDKVILRNAANGTLLRTLKGSDSLAFTQDGKNLVTGGDAIRLWNVATGKELRTFKGTGAATLSGDGKILALQSGEGVTLWNIWTGGQLSVLKGAGEVAFSLDSKYILSDMTIWEVSTGRELASLKSLNWHDWVVVTPDGLFDGTPAAWKKIIWRFNNNSFDYAPVEAFFGDFYYPGLLSDILAGKRPKAPSDISQKDRRQPQLALTAPTAQPHGQTGPEAMVGIEVSQAPAGAQDVRLFRNGSLVKLWPGDVLKGQSSVTLEAKVPIIAGGNNFTAYAFNHDNIKSEDATLTLTGADSLRRKGKLYILAVGVSKYTNREYDLSYTTDDATSFARQLKVQQDKLAQYQPAEIKTLLNENATKANILAELKKLAGTVQPEDAVVVYFSGHGKASGDHFYLVPHDLGYNGSRDQLSAEGLKTVLAHSISDQELEEAFRDIDAGQMFMIIDACNSGQALENKDEPRRGPMNTRGLAQLAYEKGMYIMTASQNVEEAFVSERLKHSYLTFALVEEGLKTKAADANHDGDVTLREWFDYALARVPKLREETLQSKSLDEVNPTIKAAARNQKSQTPRVFYRREADANPLVVAVVGATAR
jgi:WD40 repeat protein